MPRTTQPFHAHRDDAGTSLPARLGEYTHLRHDESVLVQDWHQESTHTFTVRVQWPARSGAHPYDPRLLTQTIRQSGLLVAHAAYDVPTRHQTLLNTLNITVEPGFEARAGADLQVDVAVTRTGGRSAGLAMEFRIRRGEETVCLADTEFGWVSPGAYRRLRGRTFHDSDWGSWPLPRPVAPYLVGRREDNDVLLAPDGTSNRWQLRCDISNILLFDHPVDHVPGLVLLEAAEQAARAASGARPVEITDLSISYQRYVEFDEPCLIQAQPLPTLLPGWLAFEITGFQRDEPAFRARLRGLRHRA
ncbi:ScbA/BarX family gamma-butyrolactone biosynthesis protein [Streptomyces sp. NPDC001595]|uniref:ScbA/BarX family gamma-butyrolactone biosynthesis protein n=1 Tax=Streptomyces sp. NPDC001532 TaxID=3154520 RepID=UPI0033346F7F